MIRSYAAKQAKARLEPFSYQEKLGRDDVLVKVTHCGICHSDVHLLDGEWGNVFPLVPGHEIIGTVEKGAGFTRGERVGIGWQRDSCGTCAYCKNKEEHLCAKQQATCMCHHGGFAEKAIANKRFVFKIPKAIPSEVAAPLLCGGATVYSPLKHYAKKGSKVAVIGIGGLGHLAIQFAHTMGCEVTAFSMHKEKEREAKRFGATHFSTEKPKPESFDVIISTTHSTIDWPGYVQSLRPHGTFVQVGAAGVIVTPVMPLIMGRRQIAGSNIAPPFEIREMLAFAAKHKIGAMTEIMPMTACNEAIEMTRRSAARYRMVLKN